MRTIGITVGDPAGIGPEIVLKSIPILRRMKDCRFIIFAPEQCMQYYAKKLKLSTSLALVDTLKELSKKVMVLEITDPVPIKPGRTSARTGRAAFQLISSGIQHALDGNLDALVTAPVSKYAINQARIPFSGHTEMLRDMSGVKDMLMFFVSPYMKAGLVTTHLPIQQVSEHLSKAVILSKLKIMEHGLKCYFGVKRPLLGVSALNPHAGEGGYIGSEEIAIIKPAILKAQKMGLNVKGPFPADTILLRRSEFDGLLFMYHDQAMMPAKLLAWGMNVNVTLGLPFVRTSPDHGTGFDIAGKGIASPASFIAASKLACAMLRSIKPSNKR